MNNIILCGFMGCGKTTVGQQLARMAGMPYLDLDQLLVTTSGMEIPEIFARYGQERFRELEHRAVAGLAERSGYVVATGGGALADPKNVAAIDHIHDRVVFLDLPFDMCYRRIAESDRPLVRQNSREQLEALYEARRPHYLAAADLVVDAGQPADQIARRILKALS